MSFVVVYITHRNLEEAKELCKKLLDAKLIACANYFPIESQYWWKGKIEESSEIVSLVKTKKENWEKLKQEVTKLHPYKTPCVIKLEADATEDYEKWIKEVV